VVWTWLLRVAGVVDTAEADVRSSTGIVDNRLLLDVVAISTQVCDQLVELRLGDGLDQRRTMNHSQLSAHPVIEDCVLASDDEDARAVGGVGCEEAGSTLLESAFKIDLEQLFTTCLCFGLHLRLDFGFLLGLGVGNGCCRARGGHDCSFLLKKIKNPFSYQLKRIHFLVGVSCVCRANVSSKTQ